MLNNNKKCKFRIRNSRIFSIKRIGTLSSFTTQTNIRSICIKGFMLIKGYQGETVRKYIKHKTDRSLTRKTPSCCNKFVYYARYHRPSNTNRNSRKKKQLLDFIDLQSFGIVRTIQHTTHE